MADVKTSITFNDCVYVLHKKNVPHPKSDGMIDAVVFDQETEPPKTITINKYSFRDSFQRLIKKNSSVTFPSDGSLTEIHPLLSY